MSGTNWYFLKLSETLNYKHDFHFCSHDILYVTKSVTYLVISSFSALAFNGLGHSVGNDYCQSPSCCHQGGWGITISYFSPFRKNKAPKFNHCGLVRFGITTTGAGEIPLSSMEPGENGIKIEAETECLKKPSFYKTTLTFCLFFSSKEKSIHNFRIE